MALDGQIVDVEIERVRLTALRFTALGAGRRDDALELDARLAALPRPALPPLGLDGDQAQLLWAVVAATVDPQVAMLLHDPAPRVGRIGLSIAQHAALFGMTPEAGRALVVGLERSPLLERHLIEPVEGRAPTALTAYVAPSRVVGFLRGDPAVDRDLAAVGLPEPLVADEAQAALVRRLEQVLAAGDVGVIGLQGRPGVGRRTVARLAAGRPVVALDLDQLGHGAVGRGLAALGREVWLGDALPLIAGVDAAGDAELREVTRFVNASPRPVFLATIRPLPRLDVARRVARFEVGLPPPPARAAYWRAALRGGAGDDTIERAALRFQLGAGGIQAAASAARALAAARRGQVDSRDLAEGVRLTVEERLGGLARLHRTVLTWDDAVLPDETREQLGLLVARIRHAYRVLQEWQIGRHLPGTGVAALFSGPPGTGKTMVAALNAQDLGLDLYRDDLAQVVSKWIGETEKQLDEVFAAAEVGHAVLLFDEADALFAKRTEVRGATERYANLEVNFLLQRLESFSGIALLTTNMDGALDPAFRRRLAAHIQFPHPEEEERLLLWQRLLPDALPRAGDLDLAGLAADFTAFAGAQIRNAITTAAFLAAEADTPITAALLRRAATEEARAMGRLVRSAGPG
ncbi:MAG TPA: ATP-binding protein [Kofleriaceae bacterium]|nr:ATP-binding protein [Kofleriaceae bacterium]